MTSLERKTRAVNSSDIASEFAKNLTKSEQQIKKLKSKNSELLSKYREKLKSDSDSEEFEYQDLENTSESEQKNHKTIPKIKGKFKGINFDDEEQETFEDGRQENKKKSWRKGKFSGQKRKFKNDNNQNDGKRKFKPFKRRNNSNGKKFNHKKGFNSKRNNNETAN